MAFGNVPLVEIAHAASYTITWTTQGDFDSNTAGGIATSSVKTLADTSTSAGSVIMGPGPVVTLTTENFAGTHNIDTANSVAIVSASKLRKTTIDAFTNLSSYVTGLFDTYYTYGSEGSTMVYDSAHNLLYVSAPSDVCGGVSIVKINLTTGVSTNITSKFSGVCHGSLGFMFVNSGYLYVTDRGGTSYLQKYDPDTNATATTLNLFYSNTNIPVMMNTDDGYVYGVVGTSTNFKVYKNTLGGSSSAEYVLDTGIAVSGNGSLTNFVYNPYDDHLYASGLYYGLYEIKTTPTVSVSNANAGDYQTDILAVNTTSGGGFSSIGNGTGISKLNANFTQTTLTTSFNTVWGSTWTNVTGTYDGNSTNAYFTAKRSGLTKAARYGPNSSASVTDLTSALTTAIGTTTATTMAVYSASNGAIYWIGTGIGAGGAIVSYLASSTPPAETQSAQSSTLATVANGIASSTLAKSDTPGTGTVTYYLSNDNGATWEGPVTPNTSWNFANPLGTQLKYKVTLTGNATVSTITISYNGFATSTLKNLKKDSGADSQWVNLTWDATLPANTQLKFRTRGTTEAQGQNALYAASWSDYITATTTGAGGASITANGAGGAVNPTYRYMEGEMTLISNDTATYPTVNSMGLTYAINAVPDFNPDYPSASAGGASASQITDSADANWGKVTISYSVRDTDTTSGTASPGFVSPSFEYRLNSGDTWHSISSVYLDAGATSQKAVGISSYTAYTAYWDAQAHIPGQYSATAQIRVTANDNEAIYNLAYATASAMTLDTTVPSVTTKRINGSSSTSTLSIIATDNTSVISYRLSNNSDLSADGNNADSGTVQATSTATFGLAIPWILTGSATSTIHFVLRDTYGNTATTSVMAPATTTNFALHDVSNPSSAIYRLFLTWSPFTSESGATFASYQVYRSTDGSSYSLYTTISDAALNYYQDASVASTTAYYYKVRTVDSDGDSSPFTEPASATPTGAGATNLPPIITSVAIDNVKNTSARVTWTTNTLSNSVVSYGTTNSYGSSASSASYVLSHAVYVTGLQPNTTYYVKVTSTDISSNDTSNDNGGAGYTFTTNGGPVITGVTVNSIEDTSASIFWNTDRSTDSYVYYSTNSNLSSPTLAGSATLVATTSSAGTYSHSVDLTGLSASTNYYFYVSSTDSLGNTTTANNSGSYYSFLTTRDTTPPVISGITEAVTTPTAVVIVWQTDKPATTQVEYGLTASTSIAGYTTSSALDSTLSAYHIVTITGLTKTTPYYYRVKSADAAGNMGASNEETFTTSEVETVTVYANTGGGGGGASSVTHNTTPPTIKSVTVDPINVFDVTLKIAATPEVRALVKFGEVSSSTPTAPYTHSASDSELTTTKNLKLTGLRPGTSYHYILSVIDKDGNLTQQAEKTFTTKFLSEDFGDLSILARASDLQGKIEDIIESALPSLSPPAMSTPKVEDIEQSAATISWGTNIKAFTVLAYAEDAEYQKNSTYNNELTDIQNASTTHLIKLTGLKPNTKYHYSARAFVFPQVVGKSPDYTFTTKADPIRAQILDVKPDSFRVLWATEKAISSAIDFTDRITGITQTISDKSLSKQHDITASNLTPGHTYTVRAYGYDSDGNAIGTEAPLTVTTGVDKTLPQIAGLRIQSTLVPGRSDIVQSIISWKTDKLSTSAVYYQEGVGSTEGVLKNKVENETGFVQDHVVLIPSLKPSSIYRIQISSTDQAGNTLLLPVRTIVTPQQSESIVDIIFQNFSETFNFIR